MIYVSKLPNYNPSFILNTVITESVYDLKENNNNYSHSCTEAEFSELGVTAENYKFEYLCVDIWQILGKVHEVKN